MNEDGCTAYAPGAGIADDSDWYQLRYVGSIVEAWTMVDCIPYTDYMYVIIGDVVCVEERLYTC